MIRFHQIVEHYRLGEQLCAPEPVLGGLMHSTWRLDTTEGSYAVKVLNPAVMKRPEAYPNMVRSEKLAADFRAVLPAVSALAPEGCPVEKIGGDFVMVYPWLSGRPLFAPRITPKHGAAVGDLLRRMHAYGAALLEKTPSPASPGESGGNDWESLCRTAGASGAKWAAPLVRALPSLLLWEENARAALPLSGKKILSHRDLDPKNVLWDGLSPAVIDWESAGETDPAAELAEVLLSWSEEEGGGVNGEIASALLLSYLGGRGMKEVFPDTDWDAVFAASFAAPLDWLAFNVRRAAGLEAADDEERRLGVGETNGSLERLARRAENLSALRLFMGV